MSTGVVVIGAGTMGSAIATRLLECRHTVSVFDLDTRKTAALVEKGAKVSPSASSATTASDVVILSLNHADIVRKAVFADAGVSETAKAEKLLIDMSSIDPAATAEMAEQLEKTTGMAWLDCPLSGGRPGALAGKPTVMAGGALTNFERARAVMKDLCANYTLMGGRAGSRIMQEFMVKFAVRDFTPTGRIDSMLKALDSVQEFALKTKTPLPLTSAVTDIHRISPSGLAVRLPCAMYRCILRRAKFWPRSVKMVPASRRS